MVIEPDTIFKLFNSFFEMTHLRIEKSPIGEESGVVLMEFDAFVDFLESFFVVIFIKVVSGFKEKLIRRHLLL